MPEVADLWVSLRAVTAPFTEALAATSAETERFAVQMRELGLIADRTGAQFVGLSTEAKAAGTGMRAAGTESAAAGAAMRKSGADAEAMGVKYLGLGPVFEKVTKFASLGVVGIGAVAVDMAAKFETSMVRLRTSAGETGDDIGGKLTGNLKVVSDGVKKLAVDTGTSVDHLGEAMYRIESAGYHGADGLKVLKAAAEGARAEGADLDTVANTLDSTMNSFGYNTDHVNGVMNAMVATVSNGKATMQELSASLSTVSPVASAAGVSLQEMLGAMAQMTPEGVTARQASQNLAFSIRSLEAPSNIARQAMASVGVDSTDLAEHLGDRGLTGTLDILTKAIRDHMGPDGLVVVDIMNKSKAAAASAQAMLQTMPPTVRQLAQAYLDGSISLGAYNYQVKTLPSDQAVLAAQFKSTADQAMGFDKAVQNGTGPVKTYTELLKKAMGGAAGLNTALELTGIHADGWKEKVDKIGQAADDNSAHVEGFAQVQETLAFKLSQIKQLAATTAISLGQLLLPQVINVINAIESRGGPALGKLRDSLREMKQGFTGSVNKDATAVPEGMKGHSQDSLEPAAPLTALQRVGQVLREVAGDVKSFVADAKTSLENLAAAAAPLAKDLGVGLLAALKLIGGILKDDVGPALVAVTGFMKEHKEAVKLLVEIGLTPLLLRLGALAILKPIGIIASLARDIVMFPFTQLGQIRSGIVAAAEGIAAKWAIVSSAMDTVALRAMYMWDGIRAGASATGTFLSGKASSIAQSLSAAYNSASFRAQYMWQGLKDGATAAAGWLRATGTAAKEMGERAATAAAAAGRTAWEGMITGLKGAGMAAKDAAIWLAETGKAALASGIAAGRAAIAWLAQKAALIASTIAEKAMTAAQWLLNVAMDANPIGVIIGALGLLGTAFYLAWNNSETFRSFMTKMFTNTSLLSIEFAKVFVQALKYVETSFLSFASSALNIAARAFSWIPGLGDKVKEASRAVDAWKATNVSAFDNMTSTLNGWAETINRTPFDIQVKGNIDDLTKKIDDAKTQLSDQNLPAEKQAKLTVDIHDWQEQLLKAKITLEQQPDKKKAILTGQISDWMDRIEEAKAELASAPPSKQVALQGEISDLQSKVSAARNILNSLSDKTVQVKTVLMTVNGDQYGHGGGYADGGLVRRFADGGVLHAADGMTVPGYAPRHDVVRALLSPGEGVLVPEAVRAIGGERAITALNRSARGGSTGMSHLSALSAVGGGGQHTGGGQTVIVNVTVHGSVLSERDLRDVMQEQMLRLGMRNSSTYQPYARR